MTFMVKAASKDGGILTCQWRKDNLDINGAVSDSYTISSAMAGDQGQYSVLITNVRGTLIPASIRSNAAILTVIAGSGYRVIYDGNGNGAGEVPVDSNQYAYGAGVKVLANTGLVKTGYTFAGWNTARDGSGTSYAAGDILLAATDITLYAQWEMGNTPPIDECFIATAAYGSKYQPAVVLLRHFRDDYLSGAECGRFIIKEYYHYSPPVAEKIAGNKGLIFGARIILAPIIAVVYLLYHPVLIILTGLISGLLYAMHRSTPIQ